MIAVEKIKKTTIQGLEEENRALKSILTLALRMQEDQTRNRELDSMEAQFRDFF
jgi:hypothetical protein